MPVDPQEELNALKTTHAPEIVTVDPHRVLSDAEAAAFNDALAKAISDKRKGTEIWETVKGVLSVAKIFMSI